MTMLDLSRKHDRATELRAIADGRLMLRVRNGVTVPRSMLAMIADEFEAMSTALAAKDAELEHQKGATRFHQANWQTEKLRADRAEAALAEANKALDALLELNDNHSPFGGELYQDRVDRAWDAARRAREHGGENV